MAKLKLYFYNAKFSLRRYQFIKISRMHKDFLHEGTNFIKSQDMLSE
jgi:hypothetical protein